MVGWVPISALFEAPRLRRTAYRSGRRELLGIETRRGIVGFEAPGEKKIVPKRKRPDDDKNPLAKTVFRASTSRSRRW